MKPTQKHIEEAAEALEALAYYPSGSAGAKASIMALMRDMVSTKAELDWLISAMINRVGQWKGTAELRAVFCTKFKPKDGIEAWSEISGFTPADSEAAYFLEQSEQNTPKKLAAPVEADLYALVKKKRLKAPDEKKPPESEAAGLKKITGTVIE